MRDTRRRRRPAPPAELPAELPQRGEYADDTGGILIEFRHGLGDLVQLSVIIKHLRRRTRMRRSTWCAMTTRSDRTAGGTATVWLPPSALEARRMGPGYQAGLPRLRWGRRRVPGDKTVSVSHGGPPDRTATRAVHLRPGDRRGRKCGAARYLGQITGRPDDSPGKFPVAIIHYQGTSSRMQKDLTHDTAAARATRLRCAGGSRSCLISNGIRR